ncbi:hypothetical protein EVAR_102518_1 [Eumeta japonica]|uniref:Uncharacterized protein n=1 Tax=Eumeta variegata TaxID=151549 RepID=A0A4C1SIK5_EUMVA|nr:hypothetical protein EVAR_102518_1 [Eumeta japonica]
MRFLLTKTPRTLVLSRKKDFQRNRVALDEFLGDCQRTPREDQDFCLDYRRGLRGCTGPSRTREAVCRVGYNRTGDHAGDHILSSQLALAKNLKPSPGSSILSEKFMRRSVVAW